MPRKARFLGDRLPAFVALFAWRVTNYGGYAFPL
jgi:hypothetical protein